MQSNRLHPLSHSKSQLLKGLNSIRIRDEVEEAIMENVEIIGRVTGNKEVVAAILVGHGLVQHPSLVLVVRKMEAIVDNPKTVGTIDQVVTVGIVAKITPTRIGQGERYCQWNC